MDRVLARNAHERAPPPVICVVCIPDNLTGPNGAGRRFLPAPIPIGAVGLRREKSLFLLPHSPLATLHSPLATGHSSLATSHPYFPALHGIAPASARKAMQRVARDAFSRMSERIFFIPRTIWI